ncbi:hypothetical protein CVT24_012463 [Panaeolus cyanescens]|uniref:Uncharacterized protein n=1 Tax=Panaeolus cyanescens TaxID=181874 RepID=A0A409WKD5_9AGAR|nr:hypothetical protein CVT24_012463 [Panaeolus cyanescens]
MDTPFVAGQKMTEDGPTVSFGEASSGRISQAPQTPAKQKDILGDVNANNAGENKGTPDPPSTIKQARRKPTTSGSDTTAAGGKKRSVSGTILPRNQTTSPTSSSSKSELKPNDGLQSSTDSPIYRPTVLRRRRIRQNQLSHVDDEEENEDSEHGSEPPQSSTDDGSSATGTDADDEGECENNDENSKEVIDVDMYDAANDDGHQNATRNDGHVPEVDGRVTESDRVVAVVEDDVVEVGVVVLPPLLVVTIANGGGIG